MLIIQLQTKSLIGLNQYPDVEVEQHEGGQPIYQYFFAVE